MRNLCPSVREHSEREQTYHDTAEIAVAALDPAKHDIEMLVTEMAKKMAEAKLAEMANCSEETAKAGGSE